MAHIHALKGIPAGAFDGDTISVFKGIIARTNSSIVSIAEARDEAEALAAERLETIESMTETIEEMQKWIGDDSLLDDIGLGDMSFTSFMFMGAACYGGGQAGAMIGAAGLNPVAGAVLGCAAGVALQQGVASQA
jgi:hypothetical protein